MKKKKLLFYHLKEDERDVEIYMKKIENGLFALQAIVYIIIDISINGTESVSLICWKNNIFLGSLKYKNFRLNQKRLKIESTSY